MRHLVIGVCAALILMNVYASVVVFRAPLSSNAQKAMQLGFVWLLPLIGAPLAVQILKRDAQFTADGGAGREMSPDRWWVAADWGENCSGQDSTETDC
jgi:hypothetical protein